MLEVRGRTRVLFLLQDLQKLYLDRCLMMLVVGNLWLLQYNIFRWLPIYWECSYILQDPGWLNYQGWSPWDECGVPNIWKLHKNCDVWVEHVEHNCVQGGSSAISVHSSAIPRCGSPAPFIPNLPGHHSSGVAWWTVSREPRKIWVQKAGRVLVPRKRTIYWHHGCCVQNLCSSAIKKRTYVGQLTALTYCHQHISKHIETI